MQGSKEKPSDTEQSLICMKIQYVETRQGIHQKERLKKCDMQESGRARIVEGLRVLRGWGKGMKPRENVEKT
jgi:hypothetical protein